MAANWSQLPKDLLQLILEKLDDSELYLLRFRSVCSSWRSSLISRHRHNTYLSLKIPQFPFFKSSPVCKLSKHNVFLIKPPPPYQHRHPWLVRIGPDTNEKIQLWHPFSPRPLLPLPFRHHVLDFNNLLFLHLQHIFLLSNPTNQNYPERILFAKCEGKQPVFMVTFNFFRQLSLRRCEDEHWTIIPEIKIPYEGDICLFKGLPCAIDSYGKTVMIKPDFSYHLIAEPLFKDNTRHIYKRKSLLQSEGELLLVERYLLGLDTRIDVFRLDEKQKNWVKLTSLGDRVLFLGTGCLFSASASELGLANGNCVIYTNNSFGQLDVTKYDIFMRVFHLDQNRASPLSDYPDYLKLFWPPPKWISELHS